MGRAPAGGAHRPARDRRRRQGRHDPQGHDRVQPAGLPGRELDAVGRGAAHDFLWRIHQRVPGKGEVGIFNRSHYEDVLVVRVHDLVPKTVWRARYDQIVDFEDHLNANGTTVVKFFLYIDKEEQRERFQARLDDPTKRWKFALGDLEERKRWDKYIAAYEDALSKTSTDRAPWYVIPASKKWFRDLAVASILVADTLQESTRSIRNPRTCRRGWSSSNGSCQGGRPIRRATPRRRRRSRPSRRPRAR